MGFMGILQTGSVYVVILIFVVIFGQIFYSMIREQNEIRKAKQKKLLEKIRRGEIE